MKKLFFIIALIIGVNANAQVPIFAGKKPTDYPLKPQLDGSEEIYSQRDITGVRNQRFFINQIIDYAKCALPTDSVYVKNDSICIKRRGVNACPTGNCFSIKQLNFVDTMRVSNDTLYYRKKLVWYGLKLPSGGGGGGPAVDSSKWERIANKVQPKNTTDSLLIHKKLILDDYKNPNINVPMLQTKIATGLSYNNIFNEIQAVQACDASGFTTLPTINTINGSMYNFSPNSCGLGADVWELSLNFPITYTSCPGGYIDEIRVRTVGISNNMGGYGTGLKVDGTNTEYNGQVLYSEGVSNAPFDYLFIDTTNRTSISSIISSFFWEGTTDLGLDGMEVILKMGGCENKYIVLSTDSRGRVIKDTLPNFLTIEDLPEPLPAENFANTDLTFTGNRTHDLSGHSMILNGSNEVLFNTPTSTFSWQPNITFGNIIDNGTQEIFEYSQTPTSNHWRTYTNGGVFKQVEQIAQLNNPYYRIQALNDGGAQQASIEINDTIITLYSFNNTASQNSELKIKPTGLSIKPYNAITPNAGDVLTLKDNSTYEVEWQPAGGSSTNIYNSDGLLTNDRTLNGVGYNLGIMGVNEYVNTANFFQTLASNINPFQGSALSLNGASSPTLAPNSGGVSIFGGSEEASGILLQGQSTNGADIELSSPKIYFSNIPLDNTATQVMGKDANGYSVWVDKNAVGGTNITQGNNITIVGDGSVSTPFNIAMTNADTLYKVNDTLYRHINSNGFTQDIGVNAYYWAEQISPETLRIYRIDGTFDDIIIDLSNTPNIYNSDGTTTGDRYVNVGANTFIVYGVSSGVQKMFVLTGNSMGHYMQNLPSGPNIDTRQYSISVGYETSGTYAGQGIIHLGGSSNNLPVTDANLSNEGLLIQHYNNTPTRVQRARAELDINTTGAIIVPVGTTSQRPTTPVQGMIRYNSTTNKFEGYDGTTWVDFN